MRSKNRDRVLRTTELIRFFRGEATDPRDQVYGVLGMLPEALRSSLTIDVRLSHQVVYEDFAARYMAYFKCLALLHLASIDATDLPSWVPDFLKDSEIDTSTERDPVLKAVLSAGSDDYGLLQRYTNRHILSMAEDHFDATASAKCHCSTPAPQTLAVRALIVDTIAAVAAPIRPEDFDSRSLDTWFQLAERKMEGQIVRGCTATVDDYITTWCAGIYNDDNKRIAKLEPADVGKLRALLAGPQRHVLDTAQDGDTRLYTLFLWLRSVVCFFNYFAITKRGQLAMINGKPQPGDRICVVAGSKLPLCLRQTSHARPRRFKLQGHAYVHGKLACRAAAMSQHPHAVRYHERRGSISGCT